MFLAGWVAIHYFMIGAEWAFVQRYLCVPTKKDARKSAFLFGGLYLFSPFLWLLPPLLWRAQQPIPEGASREMITHLTETAYILSCKAVLPVGMLGLMLAALFSATASMISSQLNVFSGVLTKNIYEPRAGNPSEKKLVHMGRVFTCVLGVVIAVIAIPHLGGAANLIITVTQVMVTPLLAPTLMALFFRRLGVSAIWVTAGICFPLGLISHFSPALQGTWLADATFTGVILPLLVIGIILLLSKREAPGAQLISELAMKEEANAAPAPSAMPARIVGYSLLFCAVTLLGIIPANDTNRAMLACFAIALFLLAALSFRLSKRMLQTAMLPHD